MSSQNHIEDFRDKVRRGRTCIGIGVGLNDPQISEMAGDIGYDFTWLDMEHAPMNIETGLAHVMACRGTGCAPFVRVPSHDPVLIKPFLELAPAGIIVPRIQTVEDTRTAVAACRYPPKGIRGYGPTRGATYKGLDQKAFLDTAENEPMVFVQIEDIEAVRNIDGILAVEGLEGIAIGPNDLSGTMGMLGNPDAPEVVAEIDRVIEKARRTDKLIGVSTGFSPESFAGWIGKGVHWITLNTDFINFFRESKRVLDDAHGLVEEA